MSSLTSRPFHFNISHVAEVVSLEDLNDEQRRELCQDIQPSSAATKVLRVTISPVIHAEGLSQSKRKSKLYSAEAVDEVLVRIAPTSRHLRVIKVWPVTHYVADASPPRTGRKSGMSLAVSSSGRLILGGEVKNQRSRIVTAASCTGEAAAWMFVEPRLPNTACFELLMLCAVVEPTEVDDLFLSCRAEARSKGRTIYRVHRGNHRILVR